MAKIKGLNTVTVIGRLTADPQTKEVGENHTRTTFTVAVDRGSRKDGSDLGADFIPVQAWDALGSKVVQTYAKKGTSVAVNGSLRIDTYDKDGEKKTFAYILADSVQLLGGPAQKNEEAAQETELDVSSDELPF